MFSATIIIATYNRAAMIHETLAAMKQVDRDSIDAEWVVVNNNSKDETGDVLESFRNELPLTVLNESKPGKNRALNRALKEARLRDVLVFTDDDVTPARNWLKQIQSSCERWPNHAVFGGKIDLRWPNGGRPSWVVDPGLLSLGYCQHDFGKQERVYPAGVYPFGANLWLRKTTFDEGRLYREDMGPVQNSRIMGSETSFLAQLAGAGLEMVYCPEAVVEHRLKPNDCDCRVLFKRAYSLGRGTAQIGSIHHQGLLQAWPAVWYAREAMKICFGSVKLAASYCRLQKRRRVERVCQAYVYLGRTIETARMANKSRSGQMIR